MKKWQCPDCDSFNPETVDNCLTCGSHRTGAFQTVDGTPADLQVACPHCDGKNPPTRSLCQWCGKTLPAEAFPQMDQSQEQAQKGSQPMTESNQLSGAPDPARVTGQPPPGAMNAFMPVSTEETDLAAQKRQEGSKSSRPCFSCSVMMEPDEWVLVAGPKLLCRVCFHEEFGARADEKRGGDYAIPDSGNAYKSKPHKDTETDAMDAKNAADTAVRGLNLRGAAAYLGTGLLCLAGGGVVTWMWTFTWGFTPLAAGAVLTAFGLVKLWSNDPLK